MDSELQAIFARQDQIIRRCQALERLTPDELRTLVGRDWPVVLPGVYASSRAPLTRRQHIRAGLLLAGDEALVADSTALAAYGVPYLPVDDRLWFLNPDSVQRGSRQFVGIRRTFRLPEPVIVDGFPTVPPYRALCQFVARHPNERDGLAVAAAVVQRRLASVEQVRAEAYEGPTRGRPRLLRVVDQLDAGIRSAPEADFRNLVSHTSGLPEPRWNWLLELPDGRLVSPDAMWISAGLVHEVNGRDSHSAEQAGEDVFEDMQRRADAMVTAGLIVLSNTPRRIVREGKAIGKELLACYKRQAGRGLPPGVRVVRAGPPGTPGDVTLLGKLGRSDLTSPHQCDIDGHGVSG